MNRPKVGHSKCAANTLHHTALRKVPDCGCGEPLAAERAFAVSSSGAVVDSERPCVEPKFEHSGE